MLRRKHKVERSAFPVTLKQGRRFGLAHTSLTLHRGGEGRRLSFVVSKAVAPKAHDRNRLKRLGNTVAESVIDFSKLDPWRAVCFFKKGAINLPPQLLRLELLELFRTAKLID